MKTIAELALECGVHRTTLNKWADRMLKKNPNATFIRKSGSILLIDEHSQEFQAERSGFNVGRPRKKKSMNKVAFTSIPLAKRPEPDVWQVLIEQASQGQAVLLQDGDGYAVQFADEPEPIPFNRLGYSSKIGLYDKRQFPSL